MIYHSSSFNFNDCKPYLYLLTILLSLRWMQCKAMNETFGSCRPWAHDNLADDLNILSSFKKNLHSYEKVFKKYSIKIKPQLPSIQTHRVYKSRNADKSSKTTLDKMKTKTLQSHSILSQTKEGLNTKSIVLQSNTSEFKLPKTVENHKRGQTTMQIVNKQNKQTKEQKCILTQRLHYNPYKFTQEQMIKNVCLISFEEQYKYRRLRKRELHQKIFGERQKPKKRPTTILR